MHTIEISDATYERAARIVALDDIDVQTLIESLVLGHSEYIDMFQRASPEKHSFGLAEHSSATARPHSIDGRGLSDVTRAVVNVGNKTGRRLVAADLVAAAELVEAEYAAVRDVGTGIELFATPVGVEYLKMIDAVLDSLGSGRGS